MPKLRSLLPTFAVLLFAAVAQTQETPMKAGSAAGTGSSVQINETRSVGVVSGIVGGYIGPSFNGTKAQPFSADVIDETDQFLADGNHIHRESHGKLFRDSEGRTRTETELGTGRTVDGEPFIHIMIVDPVQHQFISLNPRQKQAFVQTMGTISGPSGTVPVRPGIPGSSAASAPAPGQQIPADAAALLESLQKIRQTQENANTPRAGRPSSENLGTSTMEGFTVTGTRLSRTIPAGERGNDKPMTNTSERWFSPDLGVELFVKSESPETGQHTHKLVNVRAGDPDPLLFQVPADYKVTVREQPQR